MSLASRARAVRRRLVAAVAEPEPQLWETWVAEGRVTMGHGSYGMPNLRYFRAPSEPHLLLEIGNYCSIAEGSLLVINGNHNVDWTSTYPFFEMTGRGQLSRIGHPKTSGVTRIGHGAWIGTESLIRGGVSIGAGAVVAARAVVTRDVAPYSIVAGSPAREMRRRFDTQVAVAIEQTRWWEIPPSRMTDTVADLLSQQPTSDTLALLNAECARLLGAGG